MTRTLTPVLPSPRLKLRQAILASGRAAWQVALRADLSPTVLSHIGSGRRRVSCDEAERLAHVLDADVEELFPGEELNGAGR